MDEKPGFLQNGRTQVVVRLSSSSPPHPASMIRARLSYSHDYQPPRAARRGPVPTSRRTSTVYSRELEVSLPSTHKPDMSMQTRRGILGLPPSTHCPCSMGTMNLFVRITPPLLHCRCICVPYESCGRRGSSCNSRWVGWNPGARGGRVVPCTVFCVAMVGG
jgi:hypothetical protein